jgi:hypothetical protein
MNQVDIPAVLFPVLFAYPFLRKNRVVSAILWVVLVRVLLWAAGSQQLRFLLPTYPAMSIGAAFVVTQVSDRLRRPWPLLLPALAVGLMVVPLVVQIRVQLQFQPIQSLLGLESRGSFLTRVVHEYAAMRFIAEDLPPGSRTLLLGDGRSYYCRPTCIPDPDHFRWAAILARAEGFDDFAAWAKERRITHVYLSLENHGFFLQHDPGGVMKLALQRVASWRQTGCLPTVYRDDWAQVLEVGNC